MKFLEELEVKNRRVLVRVDFNVPLNESREITDDNRISAALPTITSILERGGMPVLMSHLGDGSAKPEPGTSMKPIAEKLRDLIKKDVILAPDCVGGSIEQVTRSMKPDSVVLLENLRWHAGEKNNDQTFASQLAKLGDVYVNDAFGTAHRKHASVHACAKLFKEKSAGLLMQKEIEYYKRALENPKRPLCVVLGGAKVSSKLQVLINLAGKADKLIIGGAMANTFLAAQGLQVGKSLVERELFPKVFELLAMLARRECKLYLPVDLVVAPSLDSKGLSRPVPTLEIPADSMALDIGPATSLLFKEAVQNAETIVWNGPMGAFEQEEFSKGTSDMIEHLSSAHGLKVVGGGDTDAAIHQMELAHKFDFISTGGGAFLALLEGKGLPAFEALE